MPDKDFSRELKEFIESLEQLDDIKDIDAVNVDKALAAWIIAHHPEGFEFDFRRRDLMVKMIKKAAEMNGLIMTSKLRPYLDAIIEMRWRQICADLDKSARAGKKIDHYAILLKFARDVFVMGYSLRSLEKEIEKNAKDP